MPATGAPRKRGRRPKTYDAVLQATSELLESVSLADLSVAQILDTASVGRTSFYEHFCSKEDVVVKLLRSVSGEVSAGIAPVFARGERSVEEAFREGLSNWIRISGRHRSLLVAVMEEWPAVPELRRIWFELLGSITAELAALIASDRAAGIAPAGADAEPLAASLVWGTERAFHIAVTGRHPTLVDERAIVEPLVQLYVGTIYGQAVSVRRARRGDRGT
ncbi:MAG TPA: TetR/AcrR family transcriptional regulator [Solirubrobacteraceae bacterium]|jgi:AcrR family transcriptional regulator